MVYYCVPFKSIFIIIVNYIYTRILPQVKCSIMYRCRLFGRKMYIVKEPIMRGNFIRHSLIFFFFSLYIIFHKHVRQISYSRMSYYWLSLGILSFDFFFSLILTLTSITRFSRFTFWSKWFCCPVVNFHQIILTRNLQAQQ